MEERESKQQQKQQHSARLDPPVIRFGLSMSQLRALLLLPGIGGPLYLGWTAHHVKPENPEPDVVLMRTELDKARDDITRLQNRLTNLEAKQGWILGADGQLYPYRQK